MRTICTAGVLLALVAVARAGGFDDFNNGLAARNNGDNDSTILFLSRALSDGDLAPDLHPVAFVDRADAYLGEYKYQQAIADYDEALKLRPQYFEALYGRVRALDASGDKTNAATQCQNLISAWPSTSGAYGSCGRVD